jgi:hypothetical protein
VTKVFYIEDNDDNVYMLKMRLELLGDFEVLAAEDGEKGCGSSLAGRSAPGRPRTMGIPVGKVGARLHQAHRRGQRICVGKLRRFTESNLCYAIEGSPVAPVAAPPTASWPELRLRFLAAAGTLESGRPDVIEH